MPTSAIFQVTRNTLSSFTATYDFLYPATAGLRALGWQIKGYLQEHPNSSEDELRARFGHSVGPGSAYRNYGKAFAKTPWATHERSLAIVLLTTLVAHYEAWTNAILITIKSETFAASHSKHLQFPTNGGKGVGPTITKAISPDSKLVPAAFHAALTSNRRYSGASLEELLVCFRYYKEVRNAFAHGGGLASQLVVDRASEYQAILAAGTIGMTPPPECDTHRLGDPLSLGLRQVISLGEVLMRLVITIDALLSSAKKAEDEIKRAWIKRHGTRLIHFKRNASDRRGSLARYLTHAGLPAPNITSDLEEFLRSARLITF